jgi:phage terminase small subunit
MAGNRNSGGHNRKATSLHVLARTYRPDRHGDRETPDVESGRPPKPSTLAGEAAAEWDRMVARLELARTLTAIDDAALYQYCLLFAETETLATEAKRLETLGKTLRRQLKKLEGAELVELVGKIVALEQIRARTLQGLRQGHLAIRQYLVELGMTPSARTRVKTLGGRSSEPTPQDKLRERFFGVTGGKGPA